MSARVRKIGDQVGALVVLVQAGEAHRRALDVLLRRGEEMVEVVVGPNAPCRPGKIPSCRRIGEALVRGHRPVDDAPEVGTDLVGAALFAGVAGRALLENRRPCSASALASTWRSALRRAASPPAPHLLRLSGLDGEAGLFRDGRRENRLADQADREDDEHGSQQRTDQLVDFEKSIRPGSPLRRPRSRRSPATVTHPGRAGQIARKLGLLLALATPIRALPVRPFATFCHLFERRFSRCPPSSSSPPAWPRPACRASRSPTSPASR